MNARRAKLANVTRRPLGLDLVLLAETAGLPRTGRAGTTFVARAGTGITPEAAVAERPPAALLPVPPAEEIAAFRLTSS